MKDACSESLPYPGYVSLIGSMQHVFLLALGEFNLEDYDLGENQYDHAVLWILFVAASFVLLIHLLNMLIAIMGESFTQNNEQKAVRRSQSHLRFVLDNWWFNEVDSNEDRNKKIIYLVTSFLSEEDSENVEILHTLQGSLNEINNRIKKDNEKILI